MSCQQLREDLDAAGTWLDNYLCSERDLGVRWSNAGHLGTGWHCAAVNEPSEPASGTWGDNFVCVPLSSGLRLRWSFNGPITEITTETGCTITPQCVQWFDECASALDLACVARLGPTTTSATEPAPRRP